jgi:hypothetical protein
MVRETSSSIEGWNAGTCTGRICDDKQSLDDRELNIDGVLFHVPPEEDAPEKKEMAARGK